VPDIRSPGTNGLSEEIQTSSHIGNGVPSKLDISSPGTPSRKAEEDRAERSGPLTPKTNVSKGPGEICWEGDNYNEVPLHYRSF